MRALVTVVAAASLLVLPGSAAIQSSGSETGLSVVAIPPATTSTSQAAAPAATTRPPASKQVRRRVPTVPTTGADLRAVRSRTGPAPTRVEVGSRSINLPVVPVGVTRDGEMEIPETVSEVGWYRHGPRPADGRGVTVLAAHVDTRRDGLGPFARLREVRVGAAVVLTTGEKVVRYRVTDVRRVDKASVPLEQVFRREGPAALALITCGGKYDQGSGYRDNVIVTAEPVRQ